MGVSFEETDDVIVAGDIISEFTAPFGVGDIPQSVAIFINSLCSEWIKIHDSFYVRSKWRSCSSSTSSVSLPKCHSDHVAVTNHRLANHRNTLIIHRTDDLRLLRRINVHHMNPLHRRIAEHASRDLLIRRPEFFKSIRQKLLHLVLTRCFGIHRNERGEE